MTNPHAPPPHSTRGWIKIEWMGIVKVVDRSLNSGVAAGKEWNARSIEIACLPEGGRPMLAADRIQRARSLPRYIRIRGENWHYQGPGPGESGRTPVWWVFAKISGAGSVRLFERGLIDGLYRLADLGRRRWRGQLILGQQHFPSGMPE